MHMMRIVLFCRDTEQSRTWYESLGFLYVQGFEGMFWFKLGETELLLHPARNDGDKGGREREHAISLHAGVDDVDAMFARVKTLANANELVQLGNGKEIASPTTRPWGEREFAMTDPDGYLWSFTQAMATQ